MACPSACRSSCPPLPISHPQTSFLSGELALGSPGPLSPSDVKAGAQFYASYPSNPRRRAADGGLGEWPAGRLCAGSTQNCPIQAPCPQRPGLGLAETKGSMWGL